MITCPNCGTQNEPGSHFCEQCGANLGSLAGPSPSAAIPPTRAVNGSPAGQSGRPVWVPGQGWVEGAAPPQPYVVSEETQPPKRSWLKFVLIVIALLLVLCCASGFYANSERGTDQINRLSTWAAEQNKRP